MKRLLVGLVLMTASTLAIASGFCLYPYLGIEGSFKKNDITAIEAGEKFKLNMVHPSVIAGLKFNDYVGLEVGAYVTPSKTKKDVKFRFNSLFSNLVGFIPVTDSVKLLGGVGMGHIKARIKDDDLSFSVNKVVPRVFAGAEYSVTDMLALRGTAQYENHSKIKYPGAKFKDSYGVNLGLVCYF